MAEAFKETGSLKDAILESMRGVTGSEEGMKLLAENQEIVLHFYVIARRGEPPRECEAAHDCLINMASHTLGIKTLNRFVPDIDDWIIKSLQLLDCPYPKLKCKILVNLTRCEFFSSKIVQLFREQQEIFNLLSYLFNFNNSETKDNYHYLAMVFGNLSSYPDGQNLFLNHDRPYVKYLLPFTTYGASSIRRHGIGMLLRNLCFSVDEHKWLLEEMDILPALLLPLAGPEPFTEEEMEKLPSELQYLGDDQMRESQHHIRAYLLEALYKLCATRYGRTYLRAKHVYYILRNLRQWESMPQVIEAVDAVIEILIREEDDINVDNLTALEVPPELVEKFKAMTVESDYYV